MTLGLFRKLLVIAGLSTFLCAGAVRAHPEDDPAQRTVIGNGLVRVTGVLDGRRDRIDMAGIAVTVNGSPASLDRDGGFVLDAPRAEFYQLRVDGARIFTAFQTFGAEEIADASCGCLTIPAIELVERKKGRIELFFAGDTMAGRRYFDPPAGERVLLYPQSVDAGLDALLAPMKPYIESADLASVNLETVLAEDEPGPKLPGKRIAFVSTPALAGALARAGVDYVTLGNNHVYDFQQPGIAQTLAAVDAAGLARSGAGHDEMAADRSAEVTLGKHKLSLIGYVGWEGSNGAHQAATDAKGGAALGTRGQVRRSVIKAKRARRIPIVQYHGGSEYSDRPGPTTLGRLREAAEHGAPLVIGHHPHVIQGVEIYRGSLIAPSIGNFLFDQQFLSTQTGYVVKAILDKGRFLRAEIVPIAIVDYRPVPAVGRARESVLRRLFGLSAERGTHLDMSGGHAVVRRDAMEPRRVAETPCSNGRDEFRLAQFAPLCPMPGQRLGREVLGRGDFALARAHDGFERAFGAENASVDFGAAGGDNQRLVLRPLAPDKPVALYTQGYLRDVSAGDYVLSARIRLPSAARVELLVKDRPERGAKPTARWRGEMVDAVDRLGGAEWQDIRFAFTLPAKVDGGEPSFRPILRFVWHDREGTMLPIAVDDLALVALASPGDAPDLAARWRATHLGKAALATR